MSAHQRRKGRAGEREVAALLGDAGLEPELRYGQEELGGLLGDIDSVAGNWEVKRRAGLPSWLSPAESVRGVWVRRDRGPWLVVVRAEDLLRLLRLERNTTASPDARGDGDATTEGSTT